MRIKDQEKCKRIEKYAVILLFCNKPSVCIKNQKQNAIKSFKRMRVENINTNTNIFQ